MNAISLQITLDESLFESKTLQERIRELKEGLIIRDYLKGKLSMGEVAQHLAMNYITAHEWMNRQGIQTTRSLPPDLDKIAVQNMEDVAKELGI